MDAVGNGKRLAAMPSCSVEDQQNPLAFSHTNACSKMLSRDSKDIHIHCWEQQPIRISRFGMQEP